MKNPVLFSVHWREEKEPSRSEKLCDLNVTHKGNLGIPDHLTLRRPVLPSEGRRVQPAAGSGEACHTTRHIFEANSMNSHAQWNKPGLERDLHLLRFC